MKNNKKNGMISFLTGVKYLSLLIGILTGLRLASILWQKSILQLIVEGWTNDIVTIYLSIVIIFAVGAIMNYTEGKRLEKEAQEYNYERYRLEVEEEFRNMLKK